MRRRDFLALVGDAAALWPFSSTAQSQMAHVAILMSLPVSDPVVAPGWRKFTEALKERGWIEGRNIAFSIRSTEGHAERYRPLAAELVALHPDVIVGVTTQAVEALREQTDTIPIVMRGVADPIASGFVASLARPGGNITGPSSQASDIQEKSLQLLKEVRPEMVRVALLWTPENAASRRDRERIAAVAPKLGVTLESVPIRSAEDLANALAVMAQNQPDALLVHATAVLQVNNKATIAFALAQRLATFASPATQMAREGLLLGFGPDFPAEYRVAAGYVDRILRGAKPAELPVEQPTKFELVINLRTARTIGLEIAPSLLARADEVIE
jgi:ABC-type uncharacterized transport system substrate-binding protein